MIGPVGRLGHYTATHFRVVLIAWLLVAVVLGFLGTRVETALSGAGWETSGSQSVQARQLVDRNFHGLSSYGLLAVISSRAETVSDPSFQSAVAQVEHALRADGAVSTVVPPTAGVSISRDGHVAIVRAGAARDSNAMVQAADRLKGQVAALSSGGVRASLTGAPAMWSDFNTANRSAMLRSEVISWPVTLLILLVAFGSLVAAGLPLMLTMVGLLAAAGSLYLATKVLPVSIWAMNFALMFALALGVDYALFIVHRFRAVFGSSRLSAEEAIAVTMDTAGKAVMFSGVTVLISLSAVMLVPSPAFRSTSLGIMLAVIFVLAATLTLLPAVLAKLDRRVEKLALPWADSGERRSDRFAAWGERLWRRPVAYGALALAVLLALAIPATQLKTAMPSIKVVPSADSSRIGYDRIKAAMGPGATGPMQVIAPAAHAAQVTRVVRRDPGIAALLPVQASNGYTLVTALPKQEPSSPAVGATIERLRAELPPGSLLGGAVAENHDLQTALSAKTPLVIGVVLGLGFLLLLTALQAPLLAAVGVLTNLLATAAAFGVAKLVFQDGALHSLLGFQPQGFLDAWGPVFFFAMSFAISMDYTVFLLYSAKEHWDRTHDAKGAMIGGLARSGPVIFAAGAEMVAVFFTFALSGPLPPKEMGIILGSAVLLDAALIRLLLLPVALRLMGDRAWYRPTLGRARPSRYLPRTGVSGAVRTTSKRLPVLFVVDHDRNSLDLLLSDLSRRFGNDFAVRGESSPADALSVLGELAGAVQPVALLFLEDTSLDFLARAHELHPHAKRVLLIERDYSSTSSAVQAMTLGQADYHIVRPWADDETMYGAMSEYLGSWTREQKPRFEEFRIVAAADDSRALQLRDVMTRFSMPFGFYPVQTAAGHRLLDQAGLDTSRLPAVIRYDGQVTIDPSLPELARAIGVSVKNNIETCDVAIVGAGPAGLTAAVYAASEGLETVLLERWVSGGQAGASPLIRNYPGFPHGINGGVLMARTCEQAWLMGAHTVFAQQAVALERRGNHRVVRLLDGSELRARAVVISTGIEWRRLGVQRLEALVGRGVFYGAAASESHAMQDQDVFVVGAGNAAGQAALHLAKYARSVALLVRGDSIAKSMSSYLVREIEATPHVAVRHRTEVVDGAGDGPLESITLADRANGTHEQVSAAALFIMTGGEPRTDWLPAEIERDAHGYLITGRDLLRQPEVQRDQGLEHLPLETSMRGVFAAGDVRQGSIKRVASGVGEGATVIRLVHEYLREDQPRDLQRGSGLGTSAPRGRLRETSHHTTKTGEVTK